MADELQKQDEAHAEDPPGGRHLAVGTLHTMAGAALGVLSAAVIGIYLPNALSAPDFGDLAVANSVVLCIETIITMFFTQALAKFVADARGNWLPLAKSIFLASLLGLVVAAAVIGLAAPLVAAMLRDRGLVPYLRILSLDILPHGLYCVFLAVLLGRKLYQRRAVAQVVYWVAKLILTILLVSVTGSVYGAVTATVLASVVGLVASYLFAEARVPHYCTSLAPLWRFNWPLIISFSLMWVSRSMDLWFVKSLLSDDMAPAYYGLAVWIHMSVRRVIASGALTVLPTLTNAFSEDDLPRFRRLAGNSYRMGIIFMAPALAIYAASAREWIDLVWPEMFVAASVPTTILLGAGLLAVISSVNNAVLIAGNRPKTRLLIELPLIPLMVLFAMWLIPRNGIMGAAFAAFFVALYAALAGLLVLGHLWRVVMPAWTVVRVTAAAAAVYWAGCLWNTSGFSLVVEGLVLLAVYVVVLCLLRELRGHDFEPFLKALQRSP